jgi:hypothetical protein
MPFFTISSPSSGNATQLQGRPVSATAPAAGSVLAFDGSAWRSAQGVTGPTGPNGRDGHKLYAGSGAPAANFGASGDFYVDTATANLYGPKANGAWGGAFSIQGGPTGPSVTGPTGAASTVTGPTGATGPRVTGPTGAASSVTGPTGSAGPTGAASSVTGPTGAASIVTGPTGAASTVTGPTGPSGGPTGPTGPGARGGAYVATLTSPLTLTAASSRYQFLTASNADRAVVLPTGIAAGFDFVIAETGGTYGLTVQTPAAVAVATVYGWSPATFAFDGTTWRAFQFSAFI